MIVIYQDIGGAHSSVVAANIHLNRLPSDVVPDKKDILALPTFDKIQLKDWGHLIYIGEDEFGAKVYTLSRQRKPELVIPAITDMYSILIGDTKGLYIMNTIPAVNVWMAIGGYSSRMLGLVGFGRPIVAYGVLKAYKKIAVIVGQVKDMIKKDMIKKDMT